MSEMIERVARAVMIEDTCGYSLGEERVFCDDARLDDDLRRRVCACKDTARAALEAMRDPTDWMITMGACYEDQDHLIVDEGAIASDVWKAMIGAAIGEKK